ncbi:MAG: alpha/beta fold hydrolase BchO [Planctomycetota bacterium]
MTLETRQFRAGPHDWRVIEGGDGPLVLLLHGAGASAESFAGVMAELACAFRVVAPDLPGHGGTRLGSTARSGLKTMAADVVAMVSEAYGTPSLIVGHSAGGAVALQTDGIWGEAPRVLINPALAPFDGAAGWVFPGLARTLALTPFVTGMIARSFSGAGQIRRLLAATGSPVTDEGVARYRALASRREHIRGTLMMMAAWDVRPLRARLPAFQAPVLFILATGDGTVAPDVARLEAQRMPIARSREIDGGHLVHEERPGDVAKLISEFASATNA